MGWIAKLAGLAIPSWGVWALAAAAFAAWGGWCGFKGYMMGMENYNELRINLAAQAAEQEANTKSTIKAHQKLLEAINEKAKLQREADALKLSIADQRVRDALKSRTKLLPSAPSGSPSDQRICTTREAIDRDVGDAIERITTRHAGRTKPGVEESLRAVNLVLFCKEWAKGFQQDVSSASR
jgi:hypothetical protein